MSWLAVVASAVAAVMPPRPPSKPTARPEPTDEPSADDVDGAPEPGAESGRVDAPDDPDTAPRQLGRAVLFLPRMVFAIGFAPVRGALWAYDRYQLRERYYQIFWNEERTIGLVPIARLESGYGLTAGAKLVDRDLFGEGEHLSLRAAKGGRYRYLMSGELRTGRRLGDRAELELVGEYEGRSRDSFYGIGDLDDAPRARFRQKVKRGIVSADLGGAAPLHLRVSGALASFDFADNPDEPSIDDLFPRMEALGFEGFRQGYGELELRWDTRRPSTFWEVTAVPSTGWLLLGFGGRALVSDDLPDYWRYGVDLQRYLRVGAGPRVLSARLYGEAVSGDRDEVPFNQLPKLGGWRLLRGYPLDRFRDRVAAVGSLEYSWDLMRELSASVFVDAGRVAPSLDALGDAVRDSDLRVGYGLGFYAHTRSAFVLSGSIATSIDGGVVLNLAFDPVFDRPERVERR